MSLSRIACSVALLLSTIATAGVAQSAVMSPTACTYQTCALRIEPAFLGTALVKGSGGERVARLGGFGSGVDLLLSGPDSSVAHARTYVRATKTATVIGLTAALAYTIVAVRTDTFRGHVDGADVALALGSAGLAIATAPFAVKAQRELSRAVWWYNSALPK